MSIDFWKKAEFIGFLDEVRWKHSNNYDEINYSHDNLSADEKLLTHWLCYISDRSMEYKRIWDVGGFVYSDLVRHFTKGESIESLLKPDGSDSFLVSRITNESIEKQLTSKANDAKENNENKKQEKKSYLFKSTATVIDNNIISERYASSIDENRRVSFSSRYYPSDYVSIYYTLYSLKENFDCSFVKYIAQIINRAVECSCDEDDKTKRLNIMICLFCGFYVLSYSNIGQPISNDLINLDTLFNNDNNNELIKLNKKPQIRASQIKKWLDSKDFIKKALIVFRKKRYESKRIWCCIRDYLKHTINEGFSDLMNKALKPNITPKAYSIFFSPEMKELLELPGDVWNNNSVFRKCLLESKETGKINRILREKYDRKETNVYPEQFDVSFAFVPRMCEQGKCKYCPISNDRDKAEIKKLCSSQGQYCPAVLMYTGFFYECSEKKECKLLKIIE